MDKAAGFCILTVRKAKPLRCVYDWSTYSLALLLVFSRPALASASNDTIIDNRLLLTLCIPLVIAILVHAFIPLGKHFYSQTRQRRSFRYFLKSQVESTLEAYSTVHSVEFVEKHFVQHNPDWLKYLKDKNQGVPSILMKADEVIKKALSPQGLAETYIPSLVYFGNWSNSLDHTSPIWDLGGPESKAALQFLVTQEALVSSIDYQYEGFYFDLIKSTDQKKRERWCHGAEAVLYDLACHYVAALELRNVLNR